MIVTHIGLLGESWDLISKVLNLGNHTYKPITPIQVLATLLGKKNVTSTWRTREGPLGMLKPNSTGAAQVDDTITHRSERSLMRNDTPLPHKH